MDQLVEQADHVRRARLHDVQLGLLLAHTILVQAATFVLRPTATYQALNLSVPAARLSVLGVLALTAAGLAGAAVAAGGLHQTREEAHG